MIARRERSLDEIASQLGEMREISARPGTLSPEQTRDLQAFIDKAEQQAGTAREIRASAMQLLRDLVAIVES